MRILMMSILLVFVNPFTVVAKEWCYERNIKYPNGMFGQYEGKMKGSSEQVTRIFKF